MSRTTIWCWLGAVVILTVSPTASAWDDLYAQPFVEPGYFDHDWQFFAPADDIDTYGNEPVMRTGWFGTYSRMYIGISRPRAQPNAIDVWGNWVGPLEFACDIRPVTTCADPTSRTVVSTYPDGQDLFDMTWGNRVDLGYMIEDVDCDHGWLFSYMHIDGPNEGNVVRQQRLNRVNEDDEGYQPPTTDDDDDDQQDYVNPDSDRNNLGPPDRERFYDVTDSLNMAKLNSVELNKVFRPAPLNHGGIVEPFFGVRYIKFEDTFLRQDYVSDTFQTGTDIDNTVILDPDNNLIFWWRQEIPVFTGLEILYSDRFKFDNQMLLGQLGLRWLKRVSRWNLSSEFRAFAGENFQHLSRSSDIEVTWYDGSGQGSEVNEIRRFRETQEWRATETMVGTDIRAMAAFELTRDVKLTAGVQFLGFFTGVGRGPFIDRNSETVTALGTTFGVEVNR